MEVGFSGGGIPSQMGVGPAPSPENFSIFAFQMRILVQFRALLTAKLFWF